MIHPSWLYRDPPVEDFAEADFSSSWDTQPPPSPASAKFPRHQLIPPKYRELLKR